jgi:hypothetical protein
MNAIVKELDARLRTLDPRTAAHVEKLVREALALAEERAANEDLDWPPGYFEETAGALADEPMERPAQGELEVRERW